MPTKPPAGISHGRRVKLGKNMVKNWQKNGKTYAKPWFLVKPPIWFRDKITKKLQLNPWVFTRALPEMLPSSIPGFEHNPSDSYSIIHDQCLAGRISPQMLTMKVMLPLLMMIITVYYVVVFVWFCLSWLHGCHDKFDGVCYWQQALSVWRMPIWCWSSLVKKDGRKDLSISCPRLSNVMLTSMFPVCKHQLQRPWCSTCGYYNLNPLRKRFRSQISDNMDRWKSRGGKSQRRRDTKKRKITAEKESEERRWRCAKREKSRDILYFPMFCGSGGSRSRLAKAAETHVEVKMYKAPHVRTTFRSWDDDKVHIVVAWWSTFSRCQNHISSGTQTEMLNKEVARSTCRSQNGKNTPFSDHFWKLHHELLKKCTPLWREAYLEVKMHKTPQSRSTFGSWDVEYAHAVVARSTLRNQNLQNTPFSEHFWKLICWKSARRCGAKYTSMYKNTPLSDS